MRPFRPKNPVAANLNKLLAHVVLWSITAAAAAVSANDLRLNDFTGLVSVDKTGTNVIATNGVSYYALEDSAAETKILASCKPNEKCTISGLANRNHLLLVVIAAEPGDGADANKGAMTPGPSFDCKRAGTAIETMICGSSELSALDARMAAAWRAARSRGHEADPNEQRKWMHERNRCTNEPCLREAYEKRLQQLGAPPDTSRAAR